MATKSEVETAAAGFDFSAFGAVERQSFTCFQDVTAPKLARNWRQIPHVTHHDDGNVTDLDAHRAVWAK